MTYFEKHNVHLTAISSDKMESLKKLTDKHGLTFPVLEDKDFNATKTYGVYCHQEDDPYEDHGKHSEPAYFIIDHKGRLLYQHKMSSAFGRPSPKALNQTVKYIKNNLK